MLIVVSGPSGVGKNRLIELACASRDFQSVTPFTSRASRPGETDGVDYRFVSRSNFRDMIVRKEFLEWDYALGEYYGISRSVGDRSGRGEPIIIHALARMAVRISLQIPDVFLLFLRPAGNDVLEERLRARGSPDDEIARRRGHWVEEQAHEDLFHLVINEAEALGQAESGALLQLVRGRLA